MKIITYKSELNTRSFKVIKLKWRMGQLSWRHDLAIHHFVVHWKLREVEIGEFASKLLQSIHFVVHWNEKLIKLKLPPKWHKSGANLEHEEGVTSFISLAPPYYAYSPLLSWHPPSFL